MKRMRASNFELLRLLAMLMIIFHHFAVHGGFFFDTEFISINRIWIQFITIGGKLGVNIFVLISGYFLVDEQKLRLKKIFKFWGQIVFYSVIIYLLFLVINNQSISITRVIKSILPITVDYWWFASTYFVMYIASPFLNILLRNMSKQIYKYYLLIMFILWSLLPSVTTMSYQSNELWWFVFLYSIAAYIKIYGIRDFGIKTYAISSILVIVLTWLSVVVIDILGTRFSVFASYALHFYGMQNVAMLFSALLIFLLFRSLQIKNSMIINEIAGTTFGIYLIHDHPSIRNFFWGRVFVNSEYVNAPFLFLYTIFAVFTVFFVCAIVEHIRIHTVEKMWMRILDICEPKIKGMLKRIRLTLVDASMRKKNLC